ncbi:MipA/OmpV family protein [Erythrobacter sp. JK5]|uniref:MipA/OmpV family protein n=1 Tax=Erythrobacter sp. JK5 TaxID=2829500 RepID=UPI001BA48CC1|nr:MipA/OmpV family protein [Erythrobacter sp. JK5]QUL37876.1 MipA/OmpV family protein [Erythrobacter sp. JK5]
MKHFTRIAASLAVFVGIPAAAQDDTEPPPGPPPGIDMSDSVIDDTWVTLGIGAGLVPSYSGSDDTVFFPLPLIVGRVGGVGISPNGPGLNLDLLSQPPGQGPRGTSVSFGPSFRFRNDRDNRIKDDVVRAAGRLDTALEVGVNGGVSFPAMLHSFDSLSLSTSVRWDVLGAHEGMVIEPSVSYFTPLNRGSALQLALSAQIVDDNFADYYYSVSPDQSAASGLPLFEADGGLNSAGLTAIGTVDLDGNLLNGGWNIYAIAGYSRLMGDAKDTPYTAIRGSADQFIGGIGIAYTF